MGQGAPPYRGQWPQPVRSHQPALQRPWQTEDLRPDPLTGNYRRRGSTYSSEMRKDIKMFESGKSRGAVDLVKVRVGVRVRAPNPNPNPNPNQEVGV